MSANKKTNENFKRACTYAVSVLCGALASCLLTALFSCIMYALGLPPSIAGALSFIAFTAGCLLAGFICGSIKRKGGLRSGSICALILFGLALAVSLLSGSFTGASLVPKLAAALVASCTGSVLGVNSK